MASSPLLALHYASLQDVAEDLAMLIQSSSQDEWSWEGEPQEAAKWFAFVQEPTSSKPSDLIGLAGKITVAAGTALSFSLLSQAKDDDRVEAAIDVSAPSLTSRNVSKLTAALVDRSKQWSEEGIESLFLFDLLTTAQALLTDLPELSPQDSKSATHRSDSAPESVDASCSDTIELSRALFWSHHLKAPSKLKDFNNWCPELCVWGIVRVGWPGYLCFEGESAAVDEIVRRVKGLQWHAIQLRVHQSRTFTAEKGRKGGLDPMEQALRSCVLAQEHSASTGKVAEGGKLRTGCDVIEDLGELVERLKVCGLEQDEISGALGIRISGRPVKE